METKLNVLNNELELLREGYNVIYHNNIVKLTDIINKYIKPFNGMCIRRWYDTGWEDFVRVFFEIGFYNDKEDRNDFGSSFDLSYETNHDCVRINYGTIGTFDKGDVFQLRRIATLNNIFENIEQLEDDLRNFCKNVAPDLTTYNKERMSLESSIRDVERQIKELELKNVEQNIKVGCELKYKQDCTILYKYRLFSNPVKVKSFTPKFVTVEDDIYNVKKLRKQTLIDHIYANYIELKAE